MGTHDEVNVRRAVINSVVYQAKLSGHTPYTFPYPFPTLSLTPEGQMEDLWTIWHSTGQTLAPDLTSQRLLQKYLIHLPLTLMYPSNHILMQFPVNMLFLPSLPGPTFADFLVDLRYSSRPGRR